MPSSKTNLILSEVRMDDISHDPFGTALSWQFAIAEVMDSTGIKIPQHWDYRAGVEARDIEDIIDGDDFKSSSVASYLTDNDVRDNDLIFAGNVLSRYVAFCHLSGKSY